jgi:hypothetical protein
MKAITEYYQTAGKGNWRGVFEGNFPVRTGTVRGGEISRGKGILPANHTGHADERQSDSCHLRDSRALLFGVTTDGGRVDDSSESVSAQKGWTGELLSGPKVDNFSQNQ